MKKQIIKKVKSLVRDQSSSGQVGIHKCLPELKIFCTVSILSINKSQILLGFLGNIEQNTYCSFSADKIIKT